MGGGGSAGPPQRDTFAVGCRTGPSSTDLVEVIERSQRRRRRPALAINDRGDVVGTCFDSAWNGHAVLSSNAGVTDLGTLPGFTREAMATSINKSGQVMGYSFTAGGSTHHFLYSDGKMTDLNNLLYTAFAGCELTSFGPINDSGQFRGSSYGPHGGPPQPVLLTPVPEPSASSVIASGSICLLRRPRCVKKRQG